MSRNASVVIGGQVHLRLQQIDPMGRVVRMMVVGLCTTGIQKEVIDLYELASGP